MGTDIRGRVEIRDAERDTLIDEVFWFDVIDVLPLLDRDYTMFGSLFGVRNHTGFRPVAAGRGLPPDVSHSVREEALKWEDSHSHTWASCRELQAVDWDERAAEGVLWIGREGEQHPSMGVYLEPHKPPWDEERRWTEDGKILEVKRITRREAAGGGFRTLFELMQVLAKRFGDDYVRLVVWFDS